MFRAYSKPPGLNLDPECITCTPPDGDPEVIFFGDHWKVLLHPSQCGLGNVLLAPMRHVPRMADLVPGEWIEFQAVIAVLEPALERAFGARLINMHYQRNWAYRADAPDPPFKDGRPNPHVHWHLTPRYESAVTVEGTVFDDPTYGEPFEWRSVEVPTAVRQSILRRIRGELEIIYL